MKTMNPAVFVVCLCVLIAAAQAFRKPQQPVRQSEARAGSNRDRGE